MPFSIGPVAGDGDRAVLAVNHYDGDPPDGKNIYGVQLVDARDPAAPRLAAFLDSSPRFPGVAASEGRAYVGTADGLQVFDIRNPDAPTLLATSAAVRGATSLAVAGPLLVAVGADITLLDVGRSGPPTVRGRIPVAGARHVAMDDDFAYVAFDRTVRVYWLRQPWPTTPAAEIDLAAEIWDIAAGPLPGEVVVAAASAGLYRLRMPRRPPTPLHIWLPLIRFD